MRKREYPDLPMVGVGGVVIADERVLLVRRGTQPLLGEWSIPGGLLEAGETLAEGVARELLEETGLTVRVGELVEALDRIFLDPPADGVPVAPGRPRYHFVILDYLCEIVAGQPAAGGDATDVVFAGERELDRYGLSDVTREVIRKAFAMARARAAR